MGVSVRVSRNTRVYMPFWVAIPVYLFVAAAWVVILTAIVLWWLLAVLPARGFTALADSRERKRQAAGLTATRPVQAPPQETPGRPQWQARAAERPRAEARRNHRSGQWQAQLAARHARRQAEAPRRAAAHRANDAARQQRKAARKEARGPWRWPEWTLAAALAAFVAFCVVAAVTGKHMPSAAGVPLFLIWTLGGLIGVPAVLWRWHRARQTAAMLAGAGQSDADDQAPPSGPWT